MESRDFLSKKNKIHAPPRSLYSQYVCLFPGEKLRAHINL